MPTCQQNVANFIDRFQVRSIGVICDDALDPQRAVLVSPAQNIKTETVNQLLHLSGGHLFVTLGSERVNLFRLARMSSARQFSETASPDQQPCISVEARVGVTTGISAADRAATIQVLGEDKPDPTKLVSPGHIFPIQVRPGGVLVKNSLREASLDITKIAGYSDAAVLVDMLDNNGGYLNGKSLEQLIKKEKLPFITLGDLTRYRLETEKLVTRVAESKLPTQLAGDLRALVYQSSIHGGEHLALIKGEIDSKQPVLTRVQPEFTFGDVFGGDNPPTRQIIQRCLAAIGENGSGVFVYLRRPDLGQLRQQVAKWDNTYGTPPSSIMREYGLGAQILQDLGVKQIELLTNSQKRLVGITSFGIEIVSTRPIPEV